LVDEKPGLLREAMDPRREIAWRHDRDGLKAWRAGRTGYPVVDAGMRQLAATGWMHNRARMVCASFLVKHLLVDWRAGERHFAAHLIDHDRAQNAGNWQWVAGTGPDAAPFFRIFNPVAQGSRFDPDGGFVRRWVPELRALPAWWIHAPWEAPPLDSRRRASHSTATIRDQYWTTPSRGSGRSRRTSAPVRGEDPLLRRRSSASARLDRVEIHLLGRAHPRELSCSRSNCRTTWIGTTSGTVPARYASIVARRFDRSAAVIPSIAPIR
jgi:hypothetical protein